MDTLSNVASVSGTELAKQLQEGRAIFSTNFGQYPRREAKPRQVPIIMRSDPLEDVDSMVSRLQQDFPTACKRITAPINNLYEYFDHYDVQMHGTSIISTVLSNIALQNSVRSKCIQEFADGWKNTHFDLFNSIISDTENLFEMEDQEAHDEVFLKDALEHLKQLRLLKSPTQSDALPERLATAKHSSIPSEGSGPKPGRSQSSDYKSMVSTQRNPSLPLSVRHGNIAPMKRTPLERGNSARLASPEDLIPSLPLPMYHSYLENVPLTSLHAQENRTREQPIQLYPSQPAIVVEPVPPESHRKTGLRYPSYVALDIMRSGPHLPSMPAHGFQGNNSKEFQLPRAHPTALSSQAEPTGDRRSSGKNTGSHHVPAGPYDLNVRVAQFHPSALCPFPYHLVEPMQPMVQGIAWDTSKPHGDLPLSKLTKGNQSVPLGYPIYQHQDYQGFTLLDYGLATARGSPGPIEDGIYSPLSVRKSRDLQKHEWSQNRVNSREGYLGQITNFGHNQDWEQRQGHTGGAEQRPPMTFSNDARLMENPNVKWRYGSLDESRGARQHHDLPQQPNRNNRKHSKGSGSGPRRPSLPHYSSNEQFHGYRNHEGFSPMGYFSNVRSSEDYSGCIMHKIDENRPYSNIPGDIVAPPAVTSLASASNTMITGDRKALQNRAIETNASDLNGSYDDPRRHQSFSPQTVVNHPDSPVAYEDQLHHSSSANRFLSQSVPPGDPRKLYVSGFEITREDLKRIFAPYGAILEIVEPRKPKDLHETIPHTLKSFSFVTFQSSSDATRAQKRLDGMLSKDGKSSLAVKPSMPGRQNRNWRPQGNATSTNSHSHRPYGTTNTHPRDQRDFTQLSESKATRSSPGSSDSIVQGRAKEYDGNTDLHHRQTSTALEPRTPDRTGGKSSGTIRPDRGHTTPKKTKGVRKVDNNSSPSPSKTTPTNKKGKSVSGPSPSYKKKTSGPDKSNSRDHLSHAKEVMQNDEGIDQNVAGKEKYKSPKIQSNKQKHSPNKKKDKPMDIASEVFSSEPFASEDMAEPLVPPGNISKAESNSGSHQQSAFSDGSPSKKPRRQGIHLEAPQIPICVALPRAYERSETRDKVKPQLSVSEPSTPIKSFNSSTTVRPLVVGPISYPQGDALSEDLKNRKPDDLNSVETIKDLDTATHKDSLQPKAEVGRVASLVSTEAKASLKETSQELSVEMKASDSQQQPKQSYSEAAKAAILREAKPSESSLQYKQSLPSKAIEKKTKTTGRSVVTSRSSSSVLVRSSKFAEEGEDMSEKPAVTSELSNLNAKKKNSIERRKGTREGPMAPSELSGRPERRNIPNFDPPTRKSIEEEKEITKVPVSPSKPSTRSQEKRKILTIEPPPLPSTSEPNTDSTDLPQVSPSSGKATNYPDIPARTSSLRTSSPISTHMKKQKVRTPTSELFALNSNLIEDKIVAATPLKEEERVLNTVVPSPPKSWPDQTSQESNMPLADKPKEKKISQEFNMPVTHDSQVEEIGQSSKMTEANDVITKSESQNRSYPSADKAHAVEDLYMDFLPQRDLTGTRFILKAQHVSNPLTTEMDQPNPKKKNRKSNSKKKKGKGKLPSATEVSTLPAIDTNDRNQDQFPPLGSPTNVSLDLAKSRTQAKAEVEMPIETATSIDEATRTMGQTSKEGVTKVATKDIAAFLDGLGLTVINDEDIRTRGSNGDLPKTDTSNDFLKEVAAYYGKKDALYTPLLTNKSHTSEGSSGEPPKIDASKNFVEDGAAYYNNNDALHTPLPTGTAHTCEGPIRESPIDASKSFAEDVSAYYDKKDSLYTPLLVGEGKTSKGADIELSKASENPTEAALTVDEREQELVSRWSDSNEDVDIEAAVAEQPMSETTDKGIDVKAAEAEQSMSETTNKDIDVKATEVEQPISETTNKDPPDAFSSKSFPEDIASYYNKKETLYTPFLTSKADTSKAVHSELFEAGMAHDQASDATDKKEPAPVHKRSDSGNASEYSTTSSRQRKLFSEVMGSPGRSKSNIIDLSGGNEDDASASSKRKSKAKMGKKEIMDDDAWKVPAGEKMWGSGERK